VKTTGVNVELSHGDTGDAFLPPAPHEEVHQEEEPQKKENIASLIYQHPLSPRVLRPTPSLVSTHAARLLPTQISVCPCLSQTLFLDVNC